MSSVANLSLVRSIDLIKKLDYFGEFGGSICFPSKGASNCFKVLFLQYLLASFIESYVPSTGYWGAKTTVQGNFGYTTIEDEIWESIWKFCNFVDLE